MRLLGPYGLTSTPTITMTTPITYHRAGWGSTSPRGRWARSSDRTRPRLHAGSMPCDTHQERLSGSTTTMSESFVTRTNWRRRAATSPRTRRAGPQIAIISTHSWRGCHDDKSERARQDSSCHRLARASQLSTPPVQPTPDTDLVSRYSRRGRPGCASRARPRPTPRRRWGCGPPASRAPARTRPRPAG
jgi:hypothetical protein